MEIFWQELTSGLPDMQQLAHVVIRMIAAALLGSIIGFERERAGKAAGLRTHILVALGTCVFVLACSGSGMDSDGLSRVIQGLVTGIGFLGAGSTQIKRRTRYSRLDDGSRNLDDGGYRRRRWSGNARLGFARRVFYRDYPRAPWTG